MNIHSMKDNLDIVEALAAKSRTVATYDSTALDLSLYRGSISFAFSAGTFGASATLNGKLQESDDNSTFTDVAGSDAAIAQMTAAGAPSIERNVRSFTKRYVRVRATVAVAAVEFGVTSVAVKQKV